MKITDIESICIFGSAARTSTDEMSDRDVLIVISDSYRRKHIVDYWRKSGWSVASYSPSRLLKMIGAGSLFIQHLKLEGILLRDQHGWLEQALQFAKKKQNYETDAKASVLLALPIERFASNALVQHNLITSDLAYVAFRNFGICHLADKGEMVFDYHQIVEHVREDFGLSADEATLIHSLRAGKSAYRSAGSWCETPSTVGELRYVLSKIFQHRPLEKIQYSNPVRNLGGGYATLRDFEAAVVKEIEKFEMTGNAHSICLKHVYNLIKNPRVYAWDVRNLSQSDLESIRLKLEGSIKSISRSANETAQWLSSMPA